MDEGLSAVDQDTERLIYTTLFARRKTTLIIAHRLSTVVGCDRIAVIDEGRVAEEESHEQLMTRNGVYRALFETQQRGELA